MLETKTCPFCGNLIDINAKRCRYCQNWLDESIQGKPRKFIDTMLLSWFLGCYGIHRFYTGYYAIGIIQLLTLGGCGIWSLIDFFSICLGNYKDANGMDLLNYDSKVGLLIISLQVGVFIALILLLCLAISIPAIWS